MCILILFSFSARKHKQLFVLVGRWYGILRLDPSFLSKCVRLFQTESEESEGEFRARIPSGRVSCPDIHIHILVYEDDPLCFV